MNIFKVLGTAGVIWCYIEMPYMLALITALLGIGIIWIDEEKKNEIWEKGLKDKNKGTKV